MADGKRKGGENHIPRRSIFRVISSFAFPYRQNGEMKSPNAAVF
jgi:hypothetical protein